MPLKLNAFYTTVMNHTGDTTIANAATVHKQAGAELGQAQDKIG